MLAEIMNDVAQLAPEALELLRELIRAIAGGSSAEQVDRAKRALAAATSEQAAEELIRKALG